MKCFLQRGGGSLFMIGFYIVFIVIVYGAALIFASLVPNDRAIRTMENQGFANIRILEKNIFFVSWRGCDGRDAVRFVMRGKNSLGNDVQVYVCAGYFKGGTIRSD